MIATLHSNTARRSMLTAIMAAFVLYLGMVFVVPSQLEVQAFGPADQVARLKTIMLDHFKQLEGGTHGTLCADNAGLRLIRNSIDKASVDGRTKNYHLTTRLIACMVSPIEGDGAEGTPGYVIYYGKKMVEAVKDKFLIVLSALALLAVTIYGIRVSLGHQRELKSAAIILVFKIGMLFAALGMMPTLYMNSINTMNQMSGGLAMAIPTDLCPEVENNKGAFKSGSEDRTFMLPWVKLDCAVESIATIILESSNSMIGTMVTAFLSSGLGKGLALSFFGMLFTLFNVMNLALFIVVLANLAVVLMFMIAPLAWVCLMFQATTKYFHKWLTLTISFLLQPVLLTLFLLMMISAFEQVICKNSFSVVATLNAIKDKAGGGYTDSTVDGVYKVKVTPVAGKHYGAAFCTRAQIQKASNGLIDQDVGKMWSSDVIPPTQDVLGADKDTFYENATSAFTGLIDDFNLESFKNVISTEGFSMSAMDVPQISEQMAKRLGVPFQSMLAAFTVLFILYAFLQQLPKFINQLATSSVASGNLNQVKMGSAMKKGMTGLGAMAGGGSGAGFMQNFASTRQSMFKDPTEGKSK